MTLTHGETSGRALTHVKSTGTDPLLQETGTSLGAWWKRLLYEVDDCRLVSIKLVRSGWRETYRQRWYRSS
jgi:hypothetical protein